MKKLNKKYAELLHQASIATGRKEAVGLLHKATKLQSKLDEKSKVISNFDCQSIFNKGQLAPFFVRKRFLIPLLAVLSLPTIVNANSYDEKIFNERTCEKSRGNFSKRYTSLYCSNYEWMETSNLS